VPAVNARPLVSRTPDDSRGSVTAVVAVAMLPLAMMLAVVVDSGRVWVERRALQTGVESTALAAGQEWSRTGTGCGASALALVDANGPTPTDLDCSVAATAGGAVVNVAATADVVLGFSSLLGRDSATVSASTAARVGAAGAVSGLRPIALCSDNPSLTSWIDGGMSAVTEWTIPFTANSAGCGGAVPGNWAVLDLDGGSNSTSEMQGWIENGYQGTVRTGDVVYGDPGIPSPALNLDSIIGRTMLMPVFANPRQQGAGALYDIVGFVSVRLVSTQLNGSASSRNVVVQFLRTVVAAPPADPADRNFGLVTVSVCSFDGEGACS